MLKKKKSLMIIWDNPKNYLNIIFTAKQLSRYYTENHILCYQADKQFHGRIDFGKSKVFAFNSKIINKFNFIKIFLFFFFCFFHVLKFRPDIFIGYNTHGISISFILSRLFKKKIFISHNFDFQNLDNYSGFLQKILFKLELFAARKSNLVILPNKSRATIYTKIAKLKKHAEYMHNAYPLNFKIKNKEFLLRYLKKRNIKYKKIIIRLGHQGPHHGIENLIKSSLYWKGKYLLILAGNSNEEYFYKLKELIKNTRAENKVILFGSVTYKVWYDILSSSDLGICLYEKAVLSHNHMESTSQKLNNYLLANIPIVTNNNLDFLKFYKKYKCTILANPTNPKSIAKAINKAFFNEKFYRILSNNSKLAFKEKINFDIEFRRIFINKILKFS